MVKKLIHATRESWLVEGIKQLGQDFFSENGYELPENLRVSCGFPKSTNCKAIGQCWDKTASKDETYEMFICPTQEEPVDVLAILLHELIHASVGIEAGHTGPFRKLAKEFGLAGKMTSTFAEEATELHLTLGKISKKLGHYPHAAMQKKRAAVKPTNWVRYMSEAVESFRVVANIKQVEEHGAPRDPWGDEMVPC